MKNYAFIARKLGRNRSRLGSWFAAAVAVVLLSAAADASVALQWTDNSSNETGFKIERATGTGAFSQIATVGANATTYSDTTVAAGTAYSYRVRAYNVVGDSTYTNTATVTVPAQANTAPTISNLTNQSIAQGTSTNALAFTVGDAETAAGSLAASGSSSNTTLVPGGGIQFGGSGANRTVTVTPAASQTGTATITVTVSDGQLSATDTFVLTVVGTAPANTAPTISAIANQTVAAGGNTGALAVTVNDAESSAASLTVTAASSNTAFVPVGNVALGGTGTNRTVTVTPAAGQTGTSTITLTVSDGELNATETFTVTVAAPTNTAPTISNIFSRTITEDTDTGQVSFTIGDAETAPADLVVSAISSNVNVVPASGLVLGGSGATRTILVTPAPNATGFSTITVTVSDGALTDTDTFRVTVSTVNDVPTISSIANQVTDRGVATAPIAFTVDDVETSANTLTVTAASSNQALVASAGLVLGGSGANRTITVTPVAGQSGSTSITVTVSDGTASASASFSLTVNVGSADTAPAVSTIPDQATGSGGVAGPLNFTIADNETAAAELSVTGSSSNQSLVPNANIVIGGTGSSRNVTVFAANGQTGVATITITVSDGVNASTETFVVAFGVEPPADARMLNLSTRVMARPGIEPLIPGFVISGTSNKRVLLRVVGPTLGGAPFNVPGVLADPRMTLKRWDGAAFVDHAANDNWGTNANVAQIRQVTQDVSAFALAEGGRDAVLLLDLAPGRYTIHADDVNGGSGLVIVEIYDADSGASGSSIINMSNRGFVGTGGEVMITGFVVSQEAPKTLLIRAVGPGLAVAPFNVPGTIADPMIQVYRRNLDGTDTLVLTHDNWSDSPDAVETALIADQVYAFELPVGSKDAAIVATMQPGVYTVVASGVNGATGTALIEVYTVE